MIIADQISNKCLTGSFKNPRNVENSESFREITSQTQLEICFSGEEASGLGLIFFFVLEMS